jgi:formylglycine-generating enzyme required for sulfatase activity
MPYAASKQNQPSASRRLPLLIALLGIAGVVLPVVPACGPRANRASVACLHCGSMLSPSAKACPKCGEPTTAADVVINSIGMHLKPIAAGRFRMGSSESDTAAGDEEKPAHNVDISEPFLIGVTEVTQEQFHTVMGSNPSAFSPDGAKHRDVQGLDTGVLPVESVTWNEAVAFCDRLSHLPKEREAGRAYRLPTEAEWEFAARSGAARPTSSSREVNKAQRPCVVTDAAVNEGGLFGMSDNVSEWTWDWFSSDYYVVSTGRDPKGAKDGAVKSFRGAAWNSQPTACRITARDADIPEARRDDLGFRVVCVTHATEKRRTVAPEPTPTDVIYRTPTDASHTAQDVSTSLPTWKRAVVRLAVRTAEGDAQGSGFIIDTKGTVVTNFHVVADAIEVTAFFSDGFQEQVRGTLGVMPDKDLAFLRLASGKSRCEPLKLADSLPQEGRAVYALGCPLGLGFSLTQGIVSGIRSAGELRDAFRSEGGRGPDLNVQWIQTTAAVNWGNSGGPLIDDKGRVVGVNTLVFGRNRQDGIAEGLNFAVSSQDVLQAHRSLIDRAKPFPQR